MIDIGVPSVSWISLPAPRSGQSVSRKCAGKIGTIPTTTGWARLRLGFFDNADVRWNCRSCSVSTMPYEPVCDASTGFYAQNTVAAAPVHFDHLFGSAFGGINQVVGKDNGKGFVSDGGAALQDGVSWMLPP